MRPSRAMGSRLKRPLTRLAHLIVRARRGASAIEFAMILPVLLILYLGALEINNALTVYRRTAQVATTVADLTAQVKSVTGDEIGDIYRASESILTPYPTNGLSIVLSSVVADDKNIGKVEWSCARGEAKAHAKGSAFKVPDGLTEPNSSVIVAEVTYEFQDLLGICDYFCISSFDMERTFYARPRRSLTVKKTDNGCGNA